MSGQKCLAQIIERAADRDLCRGGMRSQKETLSCCVVWDAIRDTADDVERAFCAYNSLTTEMGLNICCPDAFAEFPAGPTRQAVRHAWLYLVAQVARERGIKV